MDNLAGSFLPAPMKGFDQPMTLLVPSLRGSPYAYTAKHLSEFLVDELYTLWKQGESSSKDSTFKSTGNQIYLFNKNDKIEETSEEMEESSSSEPDESIVDLSVVYE